MDIKIEGWEPTPLEKTLMDGTFESLLTEDDMLPIDEDLCQVQTFEEFVEELRREMETWE